MVYTQLLTHLMAHQFDEAIEFLVHESDPGSICREKFKGDLAIHIALKAKAPARLVAIILKYYPEAVTIPDNSGKLPYDLAKRFYKGNLLKKLDVSASKPVVLKPKRKSMFSIKWRGRWSSSGTGNLEQSVRNLNINLEEDSDSHNKDDTLGNLEDDLIKYRSSRTIKGLSFSNTINNYKGGGNKTVSK